MYESYIIEKSIKLFKFKFLSLEAILKKKCLCFPAFQKCSSFIFLISLFYFQNRVEKCVTIVQISEFFFKNMKNLGYVAILLKK